MLIDKEHLRQVRLRALLHDIAADGIPHHGPERLLQGTPRLALPYGKAAAPQVDILHAQRGDVTGPQPAEPGDGDYGPVTERQPAAVAEDV